MNLQHTLLWLQRLLLAIGTAAAAWCAVAIVQARFVQHLPLPAASAATTPAGPALPGDAGAGGRTAAIPSQTVLVPGTVLAKLDAPTVGLSATVLEGSDDGTLARGAGHIEDTPLPGARGNVGIAGHRDTTFRPVRHLKVGDPLVLTTPGRVMRYRISSTRIVGPDDVYVLDPTEHPAVTLVTCWPFEFIGHAPKRYIVRADLVEEQAGTAAPGTTKGAKH